MRVAIVSDYFPPVAPGGAEVSAAHLASALSEHVEVEVITTDFGARPEFPFPVSYVPLSGIDADGSAATDPRSQFDGRVRPFSRPFHYAQFGRRLASLARKREFDVIHTQQSGSEIAAYISSPVHRLPRVTTLRGYGHIARKWRDDAALRHGLPVATGGGGIGSKLRSRVSNSALHSSSHVFTVSEFVRDAHVRNGAISEASSSAVFNIIPSDEISPNDDAVAREIIQDANGPIALFAGRLTAGKGLEMLIDAMGYAVKRAPDLSLVVAGGGDSSDLRSLAERSGVKRSVRFTGHVENGVTLALMANADAVVLPSLHHEPLGRVLLEAISIGKPVVSTPYGGTPEVITHGVNGLLVDPANAECLGETVAHAVTDRALAVRSAEFDAELKEGLLNPNRTIDSTLSVYESAVAA